MKYAKTLRYGHMTLILTWISQNLVVQASDIRLSFGMGGVLTTHTDASQKCLVLQTQDAECSIGYTGLATIRESAPEATIEMDEWIAKTVSAIEAGASLKRVVDKLTQSIDQAVTSTRKHLSGTQSVGPTTVFLVGYQNGTERPIVVCITNGSAFGHLLQPASSTRGPLIEIPRENKITGTHGEFSWYVGAQSHDGFSVFAHGDVSRISPEIARDTWRVASRVYARGAADSAVRRLLARAIAQVAQVDPNGSVSAECYSVAIHRDGHVIDVGHHSARPRSGTKVMPRLVGPGLHIGPVYFGKALAPEELLSRYRDRFRAHDYKIPLTDDALTAYVALSSEVQGWRRFVEALGVHVGPIGMIHETVRLAHAVGLTTIDALDGFLKRSQGVGHAQLREHLEETMRGAPLGVSLDQCSIVHLLILGGLHRLPVDGGLRERILKDAEPVNGSETGERRVY